jgi:molecular chaperone HscB
MAMIAARTHFDLFELPQRYALDLAELESRYRDRSRHWHPDRFSRAPAAERAAVLARATDLNEAYRVLRSDARRAQYLLKLRGIDVDKEGPENKLTMAPEFLASILELREELMEARLLHDQARLSALTKTVQARMHELQGEIARDFARLEAGEADAQLGQILQPILQLVLAQRYYQRFCDDIAEYEEAQAGQQPAL